MWISLIVWKRVLLLCQRIVLGFYGLLLSPLPPQLQQSLGHSLPHAVCVAAAGAPAAATFIVHCCRAAFCEETFCDPNRRMKFFISKGLALERQGSTHMDRTLVLQQTVQWKVLKLPQRTPTTAQYRYSGWLSWD